MWDKLFPPVTVLPLNAETFACVYVKKKESTYTCNYGEHEIAIEITKIGSSYTGIATILQTVNAVDLTDYSILRITYEATDIDMGYTNVLYATSKSVSSSSAEYFPSPGTSLKQLPSTLIPKTIDIDISQLEGGFYLKFHSHVGNNGANSGTLKFSLLDIGFIV